jgi:hypothetical protein
MFKVRYFVMAAVALGVLAGCGPSSNAIKNGELQQTIEQTQDQGKFIEVMGIGAADPNMKTATQRKASSRNAATVDAEFQMVKKLKGVTVSGGITIEKAMETDSKIATTVNDMVKGMETVKTEWTSDDGCVVTMRLAKNIIEKQMGIKLP